MRVFLITLIAVLAVSLAGCEGGGSGAAPGGASSPRTAPTPAPDPAAESAMAYVRALYSDGRRDATAEDWLERVRPHTTKEWLGKLRKRGAEAGGTGDDWPHVRRLKLEPKFEQLDARPVVEAPNTADRHYIRVIHSVVYVDEAGGPAAGGVPHDLGTGGPKPLVLVLARNGSDWRVTDDQTGRAG